jgi:hypothetical protein
VTPGTLSLIQHAQIAVTIVAFCTTVGFIVLYSVVARWWESALGRCIVALDGSVALTLLPSVLHHAFGWSTIGTPFFAWFSLVSFSAVPLVVAWRGWILLRIQFGHTPQVSDAKRQDDVDELARYGREAQAAQADAEAEAER